VCGKGLTFVGSEGHHSKVRLLQEAERKEEVIERAKQG
jgi:hypothetical protein